MMLAGALLAAAVAPSYAGAILNRTAAVANLAAVPSSSVADVAAQLSVGDADTMNPLTDLPAKSDAMSMPTFSGIRGNGVQTSHYLQQPGSDWSNIVLRGPDIFGKDGLVIDFDSLQTSDRQVVPAPGAVLLASVGAACLAWLKRRA